MPKRKFATGTYDRYFRSKMKRRRSSVRRPRAARLPRGMSIKPHSFHRWITGFPSGQTGVTYCTYDPSTSVITSTINNTTSEFSMQFAFSSLPRVTEFTQLFDAYMITKVLVQIKMISNPDASNIVNNTTNVNVNNFYPTIWYSPDYDDANTVSLPDIKEFERVRHKVLCPNRPVNIVLRPRPITQVYRTAVSTGYQVHTKPVWLDCGQADIPHYGLKSVIDFEGVTTLTNSFTFKVNCKYYFKCKSAR